MDLFPLFCLEKKINQFYFANVELNYPPTLMLRSINKTNAVFDVCTFMLVFFWLCGPFLLGLIRRDVVLNDNLVLRFVVISTIYKRC